MSSSSCTAYQICPTKEPRTLRRVKLVPENNFSTPELDSQKINPIRPEMFEHLRFAK